MVYIVLIENWLNFSAYDISKMQMRIDTEIKQRCSSQLNIILLQYL